MGYIPIFTARKRSCLKIMFLHLSVILFTVGGGGVHPQGRHPTRQTSPSKMGIEVGGTHPTGMHCCFECDSYLPYRKESQSRNKSYIWMNHYLPVSRSQGTTVTGPGFPQGGGGNPRGGGEGACYQHTILPKFPKNCIKLKEFGPWGCASKIILQTNSCATEKIPGMTERTVSKDFLPEAENSLVLLIALLS